jgi:hypothetical protein
VKLGVTGDQSLALGPSSESAYDDLWLLLSFAQLTDWLGTVDFLNEFFQRVDRGRRLEYWHTLSALFRNSLRARSRGYGGYAPLVLDVPARHAFYSVNLTVLSLLVASRPLSIKDYLTTGSVTPEKMAAALSTGSPSSAPAAGIDLSTLTCSVSSMISMVMR